MEINIVTETLRICEVFKDYRDTVYPVVYRNVLSVYNWFLLATITLYVFVAKTIIVHIRGKKKKTKMYQAEKESSILTANGNDKTDDKTETATSEAETVSESFSNE